MSLKGIQMVVGVERECLARVRGNTAKDRRLAILPPGPAHQRKGQEADPTVWRLKARMRCRR
jgi:hypothetical protein